MLNAGEPFLRRLPWWLLIWLTLPAWSGVERVEILQREVFSDGESFGAVGPYEILYGRVHFTIKPGDSSSRIVSDLQWAQTDEQGLVHYATEFYLLKPTDGRRSNGCLIVDVPNRGAPLGFAFNFPFYPMGRDPFKLAGDGFLLKRGYTVLGLGWQVDSPGEFPRNIKLHGPEVTDGHVPPGMVRSESIFTNDGEKSFSLGHWSHQAYPALSDHEGNQLTVRGKPYGKRRVIPRDQWTFGKWKGDDLKKSLEHVSLKRGHFEKGLIYEVVYASNRPKFTGLGLTAVRDAVSYMRYSPESPIKADRAIGFGASQSGRYLRHFLYHGLNVDQHNRPVLDGFLASVAGAGRGSFHHRYAQPSRFPISFFGVAYPTDQFPFADVAMKHPVSGEMDGLRRPHFGGVEEVKIFYLNTGYEYWNRAVSLIHTAPDGQKDVAPHQNTRFYHIASASHLPASMPLGTVFSEREQYKMMGVQKGNPVNYFWCERALMIALDQWVSGGNEPPPSRFPTIKDGTLVSRGAYKFPRIQGFPVPQPYVPPLLSYGKRYRLEGIIDHQPPLVSGDDIYSVLVPVADEDGNELGGLRLPEVAVPVGTFAPWNWRAPEIGAVQEVVDLAGSFLPFEKTREQRLELKDARLSLEERYKSREDYLGQFVTAALPLIRDRYLMAEDLPRMLEFANQLWDTAMANDPTLGKEAGR